MSSLFTLFTLLALSAFSAGAHASPLSDALAVRTFPDCNMATGYEMCTQPKPRAPHQAPAQERVPSSMTNGERLARGLPLKPPTRIRRSSARRAMASPGVEPTNRGYIQILSVDDNNNPTGVVGYVSKHTHQNQYLVQPSRDDALLVSRSGQHDLLTLNSNTPIPPFLGLVQSREDTSSSLRQGSFNYLYLASTEQTSRNAAPQNVGNSFSNAYGGSFPAESSVWSVDPITNWIHAQWINPDNSRAPTIAFMQGPAIYFSGDPKAFQQVHPAFIQRIALAYVSV